MIKASKRYIGKVIDNNDFANYTGDIPPVKAGRVKIDIPELFHEDIPETDLPWFNPDREMDSNIPEIGTLVWCWLEDSLNFRSGYYGNQVTLKNLNLYATDVNVSAIIPILASKYPNLLYHAYGGSYMGGSVDNSELFLAHKNGSYVYMDGQGNIEISGGATNKIKIKNSVSSLKDILIDMQALLASIIQTGNLVGNLGAPVVLTTVAIDQPKVANLATKIGNLLQY